MSKEDVGLLILASKIMEARFQALGIMPEAKEKLIILVSGVRRDGKAILRIVYEMES